MTTKIHAVVDALGNPLKLLFSEGQESDIRNAPPLLCTLSVNDSIVNADKGYDSMISPYGWNLLVQSQTFQAAKQIRYSANVTGGYIKSVISSKTFDRK